MKFEDDSITVLLPAKNSERTIDIAVKSTLSALRDHDRLVVTDDASTDSTAQVLNSVNDPRIEILSNRTSLGVADSLNQMLEKVDTEYVARMDADDINIPGRFQSQRRLLRSGPVDIVFGPRINFGSSFKAYRPQVNWKMSHRRMCRAMLLWNPVAHSTMFAKTQVVKSLGGYVRGPAEDYELWMRALSVDLKIVLGGQPAVLYRLHSGQVTKLAGWARRYSQDKSLARSHLKLAESMGWRGGPVWEILHTDKDIIGRNDKEKVVDFLEFTCSGGLRPTPLDVGLRARAYAARRRTLKKSFEPER